MVENKILVLGTGKMGNSYIDNMQKHLGVDPAQIVGVDIDEGKLALLSEKFPTVKFIVN